VNLLTYKGYNAAVDFDADDLILVGRVTGINDVVGFHGRDAEEIVAAFHEAVDDELEAWASRTRERYSGQ
jgi:predicted HicB family RNase H-like nuclease